MAGARQDNYTPVVPTLYPLLEETTIGLNGVCVISRAAKIKIIKLIIPDNKSILFKDLEYDIILERLTIDV